MGFKQQPHLPVLVLLIIVAVLYVKYPTYDEQLLESLSTFDVDLLIAQNIIFKSYLYVQSMISYLVTSPVVITTFSVIVANITTL
jgi:hypothetical protein